MEGQSLTLMVTQEEDGNPWGQGRDFWATVYGPRANARPRRARSWRPAQSSASSLGSLKLCAGE
eukprot:4316588-Lingulodinium_polyedra.AAC.1